jgi:hypothetical protein
MDKAVPLVVLIIGGFLYIGGYPTYGVYAMIAGGILFVLSSFGGGKKPAKAKSDVLEPIVIESTRGAPYRIPDDMTIWLKANGTPSRPWWEKVTKKGPIAELGSGIGKGLKKMRGGE